MQMTAVGQSSDWSYTFKTP